MSELSYSRSFKPILKRRHGGSFDIITMQFVYTKMIIKHIHTFVQRHNCYGIRCQRKFEHYFPTGKPVEIYNYPPPVTNPTKQDRFHMTNSY